MGVVIQIRDYKNKEKRQAEIDRFCLAVVSEALETDGGMNDKPSEYRAPVALIFNDFNCIGGLKSGQEYASGYAEPQASPTLTSISSQFCELNGQMREVLSQIEVMATKIGGPFPVAGTAKFTSTVEDGIVHQLNASMNCAHGLVADIRSAIRALNNSLG